MERGADGGAHWLLMEQKGGLELGLPGFVAAFAFIACVRSLQETSVLNGGRAT